MVLFSGQSSSVQSANFWDVVVLTTSDYAQQQVYELEIANKLEQKELPLCATYHVVHDPPGPKIGSGKCLFVVSAVRLLPVVTDLSSMKLI